MQKCTRLFAIVLCSAIAPAVVADDSAGATPFPRPDVLQPNVEFWTKVFSEYSRNQSLIVDASDPGRTHEMLDFREQALVMDRSRLRALQARSEKAAVVRIAKRLKLANPRRDLHVQRGLKERTATALQAAGKYLPAMEATFAREGLPVLLTRLPLVESSFDETARSSAGAAGVWQFIPSSARLYMRLNRVADDRADPWRSTEAAVQHLKDDYELLHDWPLAITAYNHGRYGIARALREVGGSSLGDLVTRYRGRRFGFASRNYYAEFIAACDVERDYERHFGDLPRQAPLLFDEVRTPDHYIPYETLLRLSGMKAAEFRRLNPAYRREVVKGGLYVPPGENLRVAFGGAGTFQMALASLGASELHDRQRSVSGRHKSDKAHKSPHHFKLVRMSNRPAHQTHKVRRGQTLSEIARRYHVSVGTLRKHNHLGRSNLIRAGQRLRIPGR